MEHGKIALAMANICKDKCPVCKIGREKGKGIMYTIVKVEGKFCPFCRAYEKVYGVPAHEKCEELK